MIRQIVRAESAALVDEGWDGLGERERLAGEAVHELAKSISFDDPDDVAREIGQALAHEMLSGSASGETGVDILDALRLALYIPHDSHLGHLPNEAPVPDEDAETVRVDCHECDGRGTGDGMRQWSHGPPPQATCGTCDGLRYVDRPLFVEPPVRGMGGAK